MPIVVVLVALGLALGMLTGRSALVILAAFCVAPLLAPFLEALFGQLPLWVGLLVLAAFTLSLFRGLAALLLGPRAADTMVGSLAASAVRLVVTILFFPLRMAGLALGRLIRRRMTS